MGMKWFIGGTRVIKISYQLSWKRFWAAFVPNLEETKVEACRGMPLNLHSLPSSLMKYRNDDPYYGTLLWSTESSTDPIYAEGLYTITAYIGGHDVTTTSNSITTNTRLILSTNPTQWYFLPLGNEFYQLLPASSTTTEVVYTGSATYSMTAGSNVTLHVGNAQESEIWKITAVDNGYSIFTSRDSITQQMPIQEYSWVVWDGSTSAGTALRLLESNLTDVNQWFEIVAV